MPRLLLLLTLFAPALATAQPTDSDEEAAVLAAVNELWEAMRAGDATRLRAVIHPDARGFSVGVREGEVQLMQEESLDGFIDAIGSPHDEVYDERVSNEEVRVDGPFATYYADYEFWLGERRSHCGVDAFQLVKTDEAGWQIFILADTRRACE
jgi:hypothetical protein